jgi:hypothetical protein
MKHEYEIWNKDKNLYQQSERKPLLESATALRFWLGMTNSPDECRRRELDTVVTKVSFKIIDCNFACIQEKLVLSEKTIKT